LEQLRGEQLDLLEGLDGSGWERTGRHGEHGRIPAVMATVDLGRLLGEELRRHGVQVVNDVTVRAIHHEASGLTVAGEPDFAATADLVLVVIGVRPDTDVAVAAGVQTGVRGAIRVDRRMRTNLPDVLAAGDCVDGLSDLDLSYTPPFRSPWDAFQLAAQDWVRQTQALSGPPAVR
jgi:NADPH-dependent glutamate synthase beta subunit-like oxidoreductase